MTSDAGFLPGQRLWTPWRMAYVGGGEPAPGCVFCNALQGDDDARSLIVHRDEHAFVIMNLFPYNTGHLMVVPNSHTHELAALSPHTRAEMAELAASFCTGLREVLGCDGINTGINLGSAAGAGITEHLHQHIVPRWTGDANFMPIVGGTKVLPELIPATYARVRAEVARQKSGADTAIALLFAPDGHGLYLAENDFPGIPLVAGTPVWQSVQKTLATAATTCELLGWAGDLSTIADAMEPPGLAMAYSTRSPEAGQGHRLVSFAEATRVLEGVQATRFESVAARLGLDVSGS